MRTILLLGITSLIHFGCTKTKDEKSAIYQAATVQSESEQFVAVEVTPGIAQQVGPLKLSGLEGMVLRWPADFTETAFSLHIEPGPDLYDRHFGEIIGGSNKATVAAASTTLKLSGDDPFVSLRFSSSLEVLWPRSNIKTGNESAAVSDIQLISLVPGETDAQIFQVTKPDSFGTGDPVSLEVSSSGSFQVVSISELNPDQLPFTGAVGTGHWHAYEANLASFVDQLNAADISQLELIYDKEGHNLHYYENGTEVLIPPGSSFLEFTSSDPLIFDSSSGESLRPWIFSPDQTHGVMFSGLGRTGVLLVGMVQRQAIADLSSLPSLGTITGDWQGLSVSYDFDGRKPFFIKHADRDRISVQVDDEAVSLSGRLAGVESNQVTLAESSDFGRQLGLYTGIWAGSHRLYIAVSPDRKAVGYILCTTEAASDCGDGRTSQRFDAFKLNFGFLQR